jgi:hypothetical protein
VPTLTRRFGIMARQNPASTPATPRRVRASDAILLERKDDMRRRGLASPDDGDALALTFAYPVAKKDWAEERRFEEGLQRLKRWVR